MKHRHEQSRDAEFESADTFSGQVTRAHSRRGELFFSCFQSSIPSYLPHDPERASAVPPSYDHVRASVFTIGTRESQVVAVPHIHHPNLSRVQEVSDILGQPWTVSRSVRRWRFV
jgi:hypothetical protein